MAYRHPHHYRAPPGSWDRVAPWYLGWVGAKGSEHHRRLAIPALLDLLRPAAGERVLDLGCGPGVLAPPIVEAGACYTGVDASPRMLAFARRSHDRGARFVLGDVTRLADVRGMHAGAFDAVTFLFSIQDIADLSGALRAAAWALEPGPGARVVMLMTHPCFRVPRHSGWGWDPRRKLEYRRIERYLSHLAVPMGEGRTRSYHRPLSAYVDALAAVGLVVEQLREMTTCRARRAVESEIPLFLALRAARRAAP